MPKPSFNCARATTVIEKAICSDATLAQWDARMGELFRKALAIQNNGPAFISDQNRWLALRNSNCGRTNFNETRSCVLEMTKVRAAGLAAVLAASAKIPNSSPPTTAPIAYPQSQRAAPATTVIPIEQQARTPAAQPLLLKPEPFEGLWAQTKEECLDEDGPNSRTLISLGKVDRDNPTPIFDQYENHCQIEQKSVLGDNTTLAVTCFEFWEEFTKGQNGRKTFIKLSSRREGSLGIDGKVYQRCEVKRTTPAASAESSRAEVSSNAPHSDAGASPSEEHTDDITKDKTFLAENPKFLGGIHSLIKARGFECPRLATLWNRGISPLGLKLEALCGPVGSTNVYTVLHYSIYPERLQVVVCKPFGLFGGGCE